MSGRVDNNERYTGVDFFLPVLPWVNEAVTRAQANMLDFGFALLPTVTVEDLLIAKLFALQGSAERAIDLDDIQSILRSKLELDWVYLKEKISKFKLKVPKEMIIPKGISEMP